MGKRGEDSVFFYNKSGQVTVFIIVAVIIVAVGAAVYFFYPQISSTLGGEQDATSFIQNCIEDEIKDNVEIISSQGGSLNPENYFEYNNVRVGYLCYTVQDGKLCVIQQPLLKNHIESEIESGIEPEVRDCFNQLRSSFEERGYGVTMREGGVNVELLPQRIISTFNYTVTLERTETQRYESFDVVLNNNLYELLGISNSIVEWEATVGKAFVQNYMTYYPHLEVGKNLRDDGTIIYTVTETATGNAFRFASRSLVYTPVY